MKRSGIKTILNPRLTEIGAFERWWRWWCICPHNSRYIFFPLSTIWTAIVHIIIVWLLAELMEPTITNSRSPLCPRWMKNAKPKSSEKWTSIKVGRPINMDLLIKQQWLINQEKYQCPLGHWHWVWWQQIVSSRWWLTLWCRLINDATA